MNIQRALTQGLLTSCFVLLIAGCSSGGSSSGGGGGGGPAANQSPTANAGADIATYGLKQVTLNGGGSTDSDGQVTAHAWEQAASDTLAVTLTDLGGGQVSFDLPDLFAAVTLNFTLTVTDDDGATGTDDVSVIVSPAEHSLAISIVGFGQSIKVINIPTATISGFVSADYVLKSLTVVNTSVQAAPAALKPQMSQKSVTEEEWSVEVGLIEGDNDLAVTAVSADDTSLTIMTTVTYFPALDFTTPLQLSNDVLYVGEVPIQTIATVGTLNNNVPIITLQNEAGETLADLVDNGVLPDEIQGDAIYTGAFAAAVTEVGNTCYRAWVEDSTSATYSSELSCIWGANHYDSEQVSKSVGIANFSETFIDEAIGGGASLDEAAESALMELNEMENVAVAGATGDGGIWWVDENGIPGLHHPIIEGSKSGIRTRAAVVGAAPMQKADFRATYYASNKLNRPTLKAGNFATKNSAAYGQAMLGAAKDHGNRIKSTRAVIFSPFISNPLFSAANSFGLTDDYFSVWQTIANSNSCALNADTEYLNNGSMGITLDNFKNLSAYGYIHFSTHGDNYYRGLLSLWQDVWGPNNFLQGSLSIVALYTGLRLPQDPATGEYILGAYENDLQAKRLVLGPGGTVVILPSFFSHYLSALPNSLVSLSACRTMYNNSMAQAFLSKGAGAVMGYDDYVLSTYAQNTTNTILTDMLNNDSHFGDAVTLAKTTHGANDGSSEPAALLTTGANDLQLSLGTFENLGFEEGTLTPWVRTGDGRVISQLGSTVPVEGSFTGIVSTGLGFTTDSGSLAQTGCFAGDSTALKFSWNFFSEEFLEWCDTGFDDTFSVSACDVGDPAGSCSSFNTSVDILCAAGGLTPSDISFDQGDVYDTGWISQSVDISALAGKKVELKIFSSDVGDSIYDTAILVDAISIE